MELTIGSLFSGIGGIDLAFQQTGFKIEWAIEKDDACCRTYRYNFNNVLLIEKDVKLINPSTLPGVDVIVAGFPCQPFSIAGKQRGFDDMRGHLFYEIEKFIKIHSPRIIFFENVPNLLEHDSGKTFLVIHNVLSNLDYSIRYRVLRASEYGGVPQIRDRIYIVAFRDPEICDRFEFPNKVDLKITIEDILRRDQKKHDIYYYSSDDPFHKKASKIVVNRDSIYRVYHDSIKITQNHMCPTLTASMGITANQIPLIIDNYGLRKLTLRECLFFQGFPKDYYFPNTIAVSDAYKQLGNTVCVPVVRKIAESIKRSISSFDN